jgi:hypothetical protein
VKLVLRWRSLALVGITLLGFLLRLYSLDWDQGNGFHPDERQILFHVAALAWPKSLAEFLDPGKSPLNPHFFAYGSFPLYLLALLGAIFLHPATFQSLTLLGRALSALFDTGTILLTALLGLQLVVDTQPGRPRAWNVALLAAALVAFTPFQLQLSHFYAVDSMLLCFVVLTLLACVKLIDTEHPVRWLFIAGLGYGLAMATKFSAAPLGAPLVVALLIRWYRQRDLLTSVVFFGFTIAITLLIFVVTQPYALLDRDNFIQQVAEQGSLARGDLDLPYVRQFAGTIPVVYEVYNLVFWGLGLMLGIAAFVGLFWFLWRLWKRHLDGWLVILTWVLVFGGIICSFYVKFMRYLLPIYPLMTLMAAAALVALFYQDWTFSPRIPIWIPRLLPGLRIVLLALVLGGTIFQGLALLNVYSQPNTRIQASRWIYQHLPPGSVLTYEQWDDSLPVAVDGHDPSIYIQATYVEPNGQQTTGLDLYGDDTVAKAHALANVLTTVNAITMATDRLDKSIPRLPARYPLTIHYYQLLYSGQLGFHLAAQFENHPNLFGITLDDSGADESYSVFDHPTARIFVREQHYTADQLFQKLMAGVTLPPAATSHVAVPSPQPSSRAVAVNPVVESR